ncbi:hypothetical protein EQU50_05675 [Candidatus Finniella inopinata]|uniref:Aminoacyl-tRNA synthetase class I anticodon-binding domain-containing protein n=1 Tax=Candidatus Finniella inopinata TaxID=1696036 RepID=A0A4Q7DHU6_9PROT|nr:hypothetical protein [Candidatus Finniella inopinata]RZI45920.1 hypothetical protein EQU50_05675 [Candidatus Finniella inopinata]
MNFSHVVFKELGIKLGDLAQALRVALTGRTISPSLFEVIAILGKDETLNRLHLFCQSISSRG